MKKLLRKFSFIGICALITVMVCISANNVKGVYYNEPVYMDITIIEAIYGDFDSDSFEDDIRITVKVDTNFVGSIYNIMNLEIILPSGNGWLFQARFSYYSTGEPVNIVLTTFDTAIESGWYTANVYGYMFLGDDYYVIYSRSIYFDPPTERDGPGEPTGIVTVTSS